MKNLNETLFIWIGTFISIIIIIVYIIGKVNNCDFFTVLLNLSYSYLAAVIFFVFQIIIPNKKKERKSFVLLKKDLDKIADDLVFFVSFYSSFFKNENNELKINDIYKRDIIFFKYKYYDNWVFAYKNYKEYLKNFIINIKNNINNLKSKESYQFLSKELHELISKIEVENFYTISAISNIYPLCTNFGGLDDEIIKIEEFRNEIVSILKYEKQYNIVPLTKEEKEKYEEDIEKHRLLLNNTNYEIKY